MMVFELDDTVVPVITFVLCLFVIISMGGWLWLLRRNKTPLWYFFGSIVFAKMAIASLAISWFFHAPPIYARTLVLISVVIQSAVVIIYWRRRNDGNA